MTRAHQLRRVLRCVLIGVVVFLVAMAVVAVDGLWERGERADAAVVLGSQVFSDGTPSPRLVARLERALQLVQEGRVRMVVVSGGTGVEGVDEAAVMAEWLARRGVPRTAIIVDSEGATTWRTAEAAQRLRSAGRFDNVIVVSQYFHVRRSTIALERHGVPVVGTASARFFEVRDVYSVAREVPAIPWYLVRP